MEAKVTMPLEMAKKEIFGFIQERKCKIFNWESKEGDATIEFLAELVVDGSLTVTKSKRGLVYNLIDALKTDTGEPVLEKITFKERIRGIDILNTERKFTEDDKFCDIELAKVALAADVPAIKLGLLYSTDFANVKRIAPFFVI